MVDLEVERDTDRDHQPAELEGPPALPRGAQQTADGERHDERRETRFETAPQRVRHRLSSPLAANLAPTSVSAAGKAHCAAAPASVSVRRPSVSEGTVESASSTIQS